MKSLKFAERLDIKSNLKQMPELVNLYDWINSIKEPNCLVFSDSTELKDGKVLLEVFKHFIESNGNSGTDDLKLIQKYVSDIANTSNKDVDIIIQRRLQLANKLSKQFGIPYKIEKLHDTQSQIIVIKELYQLNKKEGQYEKLKSVPKYESAQKYGAQIAREEDFKECKRKRSITPKKDNSNDKKNNSNRSLSKRKISKSPQPKAISLEQTKKDDFASKKLVSELKLFMGLTQKTYDNSCSFSYLNFNKPGLLVLDISRDTYLNFCPKPKEIISLRKKSAYSNDKRKKQEYSEKKHSKVIEEEKPNKPKVPVFVTPQNKQNRELLTQVNVQEKSKPKKMSLDDQIIYDLKQLGLSETIDKSDIYAYFASGVLLADLINLFEMVKF